MLGCEEKDSDIFLFLGKKREHKIKKSDRISLQQKNKGFLTYARFTVYQKCVRIARKRPYS